MKINTNHISTLKSYSVKDLVSEFHISQRTITEWVSKGLKPIDKHRPYLFRGEVVKSFLIQKQLKNKVKLLCDEFYCMKCRKASKPKNNELSYTEITENQVRLSAICIECKSKIYKVSSKNLLENLKTTLKIIKKEGELLRGSKNTLLNFHISQHPNTPKTRSKNLNQNQGELL